MTSKTCKGCNLELPLSSYTAHPMSRDRLQPKCRSCRRAYDQARYEANRAISIAKAQAWKDGNPERARANMRRCDAARRDYKNASRAKYESRLRKAIPTWADKDQILQLYDVARVLSRGGVQFHVDHEIPLRGKNVCGLHVETNLRVVPWHINLSKGAKLLPELATN